MHPNILFIDIDQLKTLTFLQMPDIKGSGGVVMLSSSSSNLDVLLDLGCTGVEVGRVHGASVFILTLLFVEISLEWHLYNNIISYR